VKILLVGGGAGVPLFEELTDELADFVEKRENMVVAVGQGCGQVARGQGGQLDRYV
jgi:hypothetical protein